MFIRLSACCSGGQPREVSHGSCALEGPIARYFAFDEMAGSKKRDRKERIDDFAPKRLVQLAKDERERWRKARQHVIEADGDHEEFQGIAEPQWMKRGYSKIDKNSTLINLCMLWLGDSLQDECVSEETIARVKQSGDPKLAYDSLFQDLSKSLVKYFNHKAQVKDLVSKGRHVTCCIDALRRLAAKKDTGIARDTQYLEARGITAVFGYEFVQSRDSETRETKVKLGVGCLI